MCEGLRDAVDAIDGLSCFSFVPDAVPEPCFYVGEIEQNFDRAFSRGMDEVTVTCRVLVARSDDRAGQEKLRSYMAGSGSTSVKAALEAARGAPGQAALSGACDDLHVVRMQGHRLYEVNGTQFYGAEWVVRVIGEGD